MSQTQQVRVQTESLSANPGVRKRLSDLMGTPGSVVSVAAWVGSALLVWSSVIHLHLWSQSYHQIPTIGPLFLLQGIAGLLIAVTVAVFRRLLVLVGAALFALGTVGGLLLSVNVGLFGFKDSLRAPFATESLVIELVAFGVLGGAALLLALGIGVPNRSRQLGSSQAH